MVTDQNEPDTIVLVHGLWMTPRSWEAWVPPLRGQGLHGPHSHLSRVRGRGRGAPGRSDPIATATVPATVAHLAETINALDKPPIIMGHSFGGTLTQLLLDRGCAAAGVAIDSAPTEGVRVNPLSQIKSLFPALKNPANRHKAFGFTPEEFHYAFTNTLSEEQSQQIYDRYHIPAPGNWIWAYGLIANFKPGHQETWVNYKNPTPRAAPLHRGQRGPHHAPVRQQVERQALQGRRHDHRVLRVRGPRPLDVRRGRLGGRRRPRARMGGRACDRGGAERIGAVRVTRHPKTALKQSVVGMAVTWWGDARRALLDQSWKPV